MGQRYRRYLIELGHQAHCIDVCDMVPIGVSFDRCLIACSTEAHIQWCLWAQTQNLPYMCEKPITMTDFNIMPYLTGYMVNNWAFVFNRPLIPGACKISYNYHNTGPHGTKWDCIQLTHLDAEADIRTDSETFDCWIKPGGHPHGSPVLMENIMQSYRRMLSHWVSGNSPFLWTIASVINTHIKLSRT